jgi:hypothetical protein
MPKKNSDKLSQVARMNIDDAIAVIDSLDDKAIPKNTALPLNQIIPTSIWQRLRQGQKGYVGSKFYDSHKDLGFEYAGKGVSGTTNLYRLS